MAERLIPVGIDLVGKEAKRVGDASVGTSAPNLAQVVNLIKGISELHDEVRGTTTGNLALTALVNGLTHDGVTYVTGDSILLKNQSAGSENGPYVIAASGSGTRRSDFNENSEAQKGATFTVMEGTTKGTGTSQPNPITYVLATTGAIVLGTTALNFVVTGSPQVTPKTAGAGLTETSTTYDVGAGAGILVDADSIRVDPSVVTRKQSFDCVATTNPQNFAHTLGTLDVDVTVREVSTGRLVDMDPAATSTTNVSVDFGGAPTAGQYRVTIMG